MCVFSNLWTFFEKRPQEILAQIDIFIMLLIFRYWSEIIRRSCPLTLQSLSSCKNESRETARLLALVKHFRWLTHGIQPQKVAFRAKNAILRAVCETFLVHHFACSVLSLLISSILAQRFLAQLASRAENLLLTCRAHSFHSLERTQMHFAPLTGCFRFLLLFVCVCAKIPLYKLLNWYLFVFVDRNMVFSFSQTPVVLNHDL